MALVGMHDMVDRDLLNTFPLGASLHREDRLYYKQIKKKEDNFRKYIKL